MRNDVVTFIEELLAGDIPLYHEAPEVVEYVRLPTYEGPLSGPVRSVSVDEYLATRRRKVG